MRIKHIAIAAIVFTAFGSAQTPAAQDQSQTFDFTNKPGLQGLQEIATILRTVGNLRDVSIDASAATMSVQGTPDQLTTAAWIVHNLDQPVDTPPVAVPMQQFLVPGKSDDVIRIFHLVSMGGKPPQVIQEVLTILRTVGDIQKVFNYSALSDLVVRGSADEIAFADYLVRSLDVTRGSVTTSPDFHFVVRGGSPPTIRQTDVARVFYLAHTPTPQGVQEILTTLRTVADVQKVFNFTAVGALAVRGSAGDIATVEWMIQALDIPADAKIPLPGSREFNIPANLAGGNLIRAFYPPATTTGRDLAQLETALRENLGLNKAYFKSAPPVMIVRGSADQLDKAALVIQENNHLVKAQP